MAGIDLDELPPDLQRRIKRDHKLRAPREVRFTKDDVRGNAIRVLAAVSQLTQEQRKRVLLHAIKVNSQ